ncbi:MULTISPECIES: DUF805 domain-containing protein [Bacillaceae]|jgi:uncharacterized membrane protein YhaH (DUF805 family)|uniref:DUF805 domain-containing protein n=1 Tax=Bacillaceae TaxID=186817 RepID=UPI001A8C6AC6|nr:DUF805 domain-containing protein [Bacillus sp. NTK034]MBN8202994.1 DUF805 domain-containing protein [Bacillus sp. NTK034]
MNAFIKVLKESFNFSGRSRRKDYWMFILFTFVISIILTVIEMALGLEITEDIGILTTLFSVIMIIPSLSVTVRRLHDTGKSGWWILISLIPLIGGIIILIFTLMDSEPGSNKYGPNPKKAI